MGKGKGGAQWAGWNPLRDASGVRTFCVGEFDWIKRPDAKRDHRSCFDCDHVYQGDIRCPACGNASGEPLEG